ncbi:KipI antagonist [Tumebacillus sp. ITR2]|uniref:KipI antagonist n=1 Tax=Tumebacillus amylolyticus TaxID=2801339 RepID=A0ABS1J4V8_9BACL|nr:KipI antagonist [Tumebacillus amylolyticus]MBL0385301.1 KipI antagonist [Tumebacillus amylolyticus]
MSLKILSRGLFSTLQEACEAGGAIDTFALYASNLLVGNGEGEAALEITLLGPEIHFEREALIAICGGDLAPSVDGKLIPNWRPVYVHAGSTLKFTDAKNGFRSYLAVAGGFDVESAPERRKSDLLHLGRPLREGDILKFGELPESAAKQFNRLRDAARHETFATTDWFVSHEVMPSYNAKRRIRVLRSDSYEQFSTGSRERVFASPFQMKPETNRLSYRLDGVSLRVEEPTIATSNTVSPNPAQVGAISVREDRTPFIQMSAQSDPTPHIARVIPVDFPVLSQVRPGERIKFHEVSPNEAQELAYLRQMGLRILKNTILSLQSR